MRNNQYYMYKLSYIMILFYAQYSTHYCIALGYTVLFLVIGQTGTEINIIRPSEQIF